MDILLKSLKLYWQMVCFHVLSWAVYTCFINMCCCSQQIELNVLKEAFNKHIQAVFRGSLWVFLLVAAESLSAAYFLWHLWLQSSEIRLISLRSIQLISVSEDMWYKCSFEPALHVVSVLCRGINMLPRVLSAVCIFATCHVDGKH